MVGIFQSIEGLNRKRQRQEGFTPSCFLSACPELRMTVFSCSRAETETISGSRVLRPLGLGLESHHQRSWVSTLQTADRGIAQPPPPHEPISHNKSLHSCIYIYFLPSGEPRLIHLPATTLLTFLPLLLPTCLELLEQEQLPLWSIRYVATH